MTNATRFAGQLFFATAAAGLRSHGQGFGIARGRRRPSRRRPRGRAGVFMGCLMRINSLCHHAGVHRPAERGVADFFRNDPRREVAVVPLHPLAARWHAQERWGHDAVLAHPARHDFETSRGVEQRIPRGRFWFGVIVAGVADPGSTPASARPATTECVHQNRKGPRNPLGRLIPVANHFIIAAEMASAIARIP